MRSCAVPSTLPGPPIIPLSRVATLCMLPTPQSLGGRLGIETACHGAAVLVFV